MAAIPSIESSTPLDSTPSIPQHPYFAALDRDWNSFVLKYHPETGFIKAIPAEAWPSKLIFEHDRNYVLKYLGDEELDSIGMEILRDVRRLNVRLQPIGTGLVQPPPEDDGGVVAARAIVSQIIEDRRKERKQTEQSLRKRLKTRNVLIAEQKKLISQMKDMSAVQDRALECHEQLIAAMARKKRHLLDLLEVHCPKCADDIRKIEKKHKQEPGEATPSSENPRCGSCNEPVVDLSDNYCVYCGAKLHKPSPASVPLPSVDLPSVESSQ